MNQLDADFKLIITWLVGGRLSDSAYALMTDLKDLLANRVQLTSDGLRAYVEAVGGTSQLASADLATHPQKSLRAERRDCGVNCFSATIMRDTCVDLTDHTNLSRSHHVETSDRYGRHSRARERCCRG